MEFIAPQCRIVYYIITVSIPIINQSKSNTLLSPLKFIVNTTGTNIIMFRFRKPVKRDVE